MARKQLIKGANAARLEARISRVPDEKSDEGGRSIFGAIKAMEERVPRGAPKRAATKGAAAKNAAPKGAVPKLSSKAAPKAAPQRPADSVPAKARLRPSDFSSAERGEILRCCVDYRNRLPTYLSSTKKEVELLDSIIAKCGR